MFRVEMNAEWGSCGEYGAVGTEMLLLQGGKGSYRPRRLRSYVLLLLLLLLLRKQDPRHTPQMHRSLDAYCATLGPPPNLDVPASVTGAPPTSTQRKRPLVAKEDTLWARNVR